VRRRAPRAARSSRPQPSRSATTSRRRAPRGRVHRVVPPRRSSRPGRPLPVRSSTAPLSARCGRRRCAANSLHPISACDRAARSVREAACVATAWAAAASATARAARVASARVAWRDDRAGRTGRGRENFSKRDAVEERDERGRACPEWRRRGGTWGSPPRGTREGREGRLERRTALEFFSSEVGVADEDVHDGDTDRGRIGPGTWASPRPASARLRGSSPS
jgi:hypothetical protein